MDYTHDEIKQLIRDLWSPIHHPDGLIESMIRRMEPGQTLIDALIRTWTVRPFKGAYEDYYGPFSIPFEDLPLHIHSPWYFERTVVIWRLKMGR